MRTAILTDSSTGLTPAEAKKLGVKLLALPLLIGQKTYFEGQNLADEELFSLAEQTKESINIAPVSLELIAEAMQELAQAGYETVICIHLSNGITGLDDNLRSYAALKERALEVKIFDSHTTGAAQAQMVRYAAKLALLEKSPAQIISALEELRAKTQTIVIDNIKNLKKTGYVSNGTPAFSNALLHLKTLLEFTDDGKLAVLDTGMRMKKVYQKVLEQIAQADPTELQLMLMYDVGSSELADKWLEHFKQDLPTATFTVARLKPSIRVHTGEKSLLISWIYA